MTLEDNGKVVARTTTGEPSRQVDAYEYKSRKVLAPRLQSRLGRSDRGHGIGQKPGPASPLTPTAKAYKGRIRSPCGILTHSATGKSLSAASILNGPGG